MTPAPMLLVLALSEPSSATDGAKLLDEAGSAIVPINDEKHLRVRGIRGQLVLQPGAKGEVEFHSGSMEQGGDEVPLAVWTDGGALRLEPPQGKESVRARARIRVPAGMRVRLELEETEVRVESADVELAVKGRQIRLEGRTLRRRAELDIEGGAVSVQGSEGAVTVRGRGLDVALDGVLGAVSISVTGGTAKLTGFNSGLEGVFNGTRVAIEAVTGAVNLQFTAGSAKIARLRDGGTLALTGCRLALDQISGSLSVESDSEVRFTNSRADLRIQNSAGVVVGRGNLGLLEVKTHSAGVDLAELTGDLRVEGDTLEVKLENVGTATLATRSSNVSVNGAAAVTVENDRGDVVIKRVAGPVSVNAQQGRVELLDMHGPVTVEAAVEEVAVEWTALVVSDDSRIDNDGGDVTVTFQAGHCLIDAKSSFGRVESNLQGVEIEADGKTAKGVMGGFPGKTVLIRASGDVRLVAGAGLAGPSGQTP